MQPIKINFARNAYQARSKFLNNQRCVNFYLEPAPEDSKEPDYLIGTPGLILWATISAAPIYGMRVLGSYLYVVTDDKVYRVDVNTSAISLGSLGTTDNVVMMDNNSTDVIIIKETGAAYLADSTTLTQVTDVDYSDASSVAVLHGYAIYPRLNSNIFDISELNDASSVIGTDFATVDATPGNIVRAIAHKNSVWFFKEFGIEIYYDTGNADFPFEPITSALINRGCSAKRSVVEEDNTLFFLGEDRVVYRMDGYTPKRISTFAIESAIQGYTTISDAEAFSYTQNGHKFYVLTFPTELVTWVYDIATDLWHERQSFEKGRWRATSHVFFNGKHLVGDFETGKIYEVDLDTYTENGDTIQSIATTPPMFKDNKRITHDRLWVEFDGGVGLLTGQGSDPQAMLRFSDDGGNTWSNEIWAGLGATGEYQTEVIFDSLGQARHRTYEINITDPVKRCITGAYLNARIGKA